MPSRDWQCKTVQTIDQAIIAIFSMKFPVVLLPDRGQTICTPIIKDIKELHLHFARVRDISPTGNVIIKKRLKQENAQP